MAATRREVIVGAAVLPGAFLVPARAKSAVAESSRLIPPESGTIPVAFVISDGAVMIDFAGPWEVFQDTRNPKTQAHAFSLYTVAETSAPIQAGGGMKIVPDFAIDNAPQPKLIVIPAQNSASDAMLNWIRKSSEHTDLTVSICTGAFILAKAGLLDGKAATTHHAGYKTLAAQFPLVHVEPGKRFVEAGNVATAGGLSSGIDLALHVVERYFGRDVAKKTAFDLEYQGQGWLDPNSNAIYAPT